MKKYKSVFKEGAQSGLEKYPEFNVVVDKIFKKYCVPMGDEINKEVRKIESKMPYKAQFILEEIIKKLQDSV